jgi:hypothetical protein
MMPGTQGMVDQHPFKDNAGAMHVDKVNCMDGSMTGIM